MRKLLPFLLLTSVFYYSCNQDSKSINVKDSLQVKSGIGSDTTVSSDSQQKIDPNQEKIAYAKLEFGFTEKQSKKILDDRIRKVGEYSYTIDGLFNSEKKLYMIDIDGFKKDASYLDNDIHQQMNNLVDVITKKYGEPESTYPYPQIFDLEPGHIRFVKVWNYGTKTIKIGIGQDSDGPTYNAVCWIYNKPMYDANEAEENKKTDSKKSVDASNF